MDTHSLVAYTEWLLNKAKFNKMQDPVTNAKIWTTRRRKPYTSEQVVAIYLRSVQVSDTSVSLISLLKNKAFISEDILEHPKKLFDTVGEIICAYFGVPVEALTVKSRDTLFVQSRYMSYYILSLLLARDKLEYILGEYTNRSRTTVLAGWKRAEEWIEFDKAYRKAFNTIFDLVKIHLKITDNEVQKEVGEIRSPAEVLG